MREKIKSSFFEKKSKHFLKKISKPGISYMYDRTEDKERRTYGIVHECVKFTTETPPLSHVLLLALEYIKFAFEALDRSD